jgi:hypothetical protein
MILTPIDETPDKKEAREKRERANCSWCVRGLWHSAEGWRNHPNAGTGIIVWGKVGGK